MAALFRYGRLVPAAVRIILAGGVSYGTVKAGVWSDSTQSREKLDKLSNVYEIEYPKSWSSRGPPLQAKNVDSLKDSATQRWNHAVNSLCQSLVNSESRSNSFNTGGGSGSVTDSFRNGLKKINDQIKAWTDK